MINRKLQSNKNIYKAGSNTERYVFDKVNEYFKGRQFLSFLNYPVYSIEANRYREIDVLILEKVTGITVIEVKALTIDQIEHIEGTNWKVENYYKKPYISPYFQAKEQLDLFLDTIQSEGEFLNNIGIRIIIALPNISKKEWKQKNFHRVTKNHPILFQEDFEDIQKLQKIERINIRQNIKTLEDKEWVTLRSFVDSDYKIRGVKEEVYSLLFIIPTIDVYNDELSSIKLSLLKGVRVFVLAYFDIDMSNLDSELNKYINIEQLNFYFSSQNSVIHEALVIEDGNFDQVQSIQVETIIKEDFPHFNIEQYNVIHTKIDEHLMISAGAGTGKTHVMIDRIMSLLKKNVKVEDIIMITFTNDATKEMKTRLQKRLIALTKVTGLSQYNEQAESVKSMKISTIHTFFKETLQTLSHEFGYGLNLRVRGYTKVKKDIIRELINEFL